MARGSGGGTQGCHPERSSLEGCAVEGPLPPAGAAGVRWMRFGAPMHGGPCLGAPVSRVPSVFAAAPPIQHAGGAAIGTSGGGGGSTTRNPLARPPSAGPAEDVVRCWGARGVGARFSLLETKTAPPERSAVQWPERELSRRRASRRSRRSSTPDTAAPTNAKNRAAPPERGAAEWPERELNPRHRDFQSRALPTELPGRTGAESSIRWGPGEDAVPG